MNSICHNDDIWSQLYYGSASSTRSRFQCNNHGKLTIEMIVMTYQAPVLLLFNASDTLSCSEIKAQLNLADDDDNRLLQSPSCAKYKIPNKKMNNPSATCE